MSLNILVTLLLLSSAISIQLILQDGNHLVFNSSMRRGVISASLSSHGQVNSTFYIQSQILSPLMNKYTLIHAPNKITFQPELKQQQIMFNDYYEGQYWLTVKHQVKFNQENHQVNFVGLRLTDGDNIHYYLLPTFPMPFSFLAIDTIYRCGTIIIAVSAQGSLLDIALFSKSGLGSWEKIEGQWGWNWEKREQNSYDFARFTRSDKITSLKIPTKNGKYCEINPSKLQKARNNGLQLKRYLSIQQVLNNSTPLQQHIYSHEL